MGFIELISLGLSSVVMVVLSKSRLHCKSSCMSCSYNEHNIDLSKLNEEPQDTDEEDERYNDLPMDSFKTLPPPPPHVHPKVPLQTVRDLSKVN